MPSYCVLAPTNLKIISQPKEVDIFISEMGGTTLTFVGKTPIEITDRELKEKFKISPSEMDFFQIQARKIGYQSEKLLVPLGGWLQSSASIRVYLKEGKDIGSDVEKIVQRIFNAQKLVEKSQYGQAHEQFDEILGQYPKLSRVMSMKAGTYYLQKQFDESKLWYEKALKEDPNRTDAVIMLEKINKRL